MSHEIDMSNNRANMAYTGEAPWHRLGNPLKKGATIDEWRVSAGMAWDALESTVVIDVSDDEADFTDPIVFDNFKGLYRSDTRMPLSVVGSGYKVVQPGDILEFFRDVVEGLESDFEMETAGCLKGGKRIWGLAKSSKKFSLSRGDDMEQYLLLATSYDRSLATIAALTSIRVVCQNTLTLATSKRDGIIKIAHNSKVDFEKIKSELGVEDKWAKFIKSCNEFAEKQMDEKESRRFFAGVVADITPNKEIEDIIDEDNTTVEVLMDLRKSSPGADTAAANGTLWGNLNAVTYYYDHVAKANSEENRLNSSFFGRGDRAKRFAYDAANELVMA